MKPRCLLSLQGFRFRLSNNLMCDALGFYEKKFKFETYCSENPAETDASIKKPLNVYQRGFHFQ